MAPGPLARARTWLMAGLIAGPEEDPVLVREGFAWLAALLGPVWALWHRLWGLAALILAAELLVAALVELARAPALEIAGALVLALLVGHAANDWRRASLSRRGAPAIAIVAAPDSEAAMLRYLERAP
jgi:hypothetical protein